LIQKPLKDIWIYIESGLFLKAESFGAAGTKIGEIVFNTSMSGYQEIISDPSYAGQFIVFTMPEIGNVGCNDDDMESSKIYSCGMIVRNYHPRYSNFRATVSLGDFLHSHNSLGICNIDTRYLTKHIRDLGPQMMIASTEISDKQELKSLLEKSPRIEEINYIKEVTTKSSYIHKNGTWDSTNFQYNSPSKSDKSIVVIDFGVKRSILNELVQSGLNVNVVSSSFNAVDLIKQYQDKKIDGIFLSNGPGDPLVLKDEVEKIKKLIEAKIPMFAICLGHQLLSIAHGFNTYKLKFGQHGGNHPVKNHSSKFVEITSQNHNYNVPESIAKVAFITHKNLFDGTIEGVRYKDSPIFSVQHHPEASPGPHDSRYIFREFADSL
jgi:carbamoyl-phosphate synthase small subunit